MKISALGLRYKKINIIKISTSTFLQSKFVYKKCIIIVVLNIIVKNNEYKNVCYINFKCNGKIALSILFITTLMPAVHN